MRAGVLDSFLSSSAEALTVDDSTSPEKLGSNSDKTSFLQRSMSILRDFKTRAATPSPSLKRPKRICSVPTYEWFSNLASLPDNAKTFLTLGV